MIFVSISIIAVLHCIDASKTSVTPTLACLVKRLSPIYDIGQSILLSAVSVFLLTVFLSDCLSVARRYSHTHATFPQTKRLMALS